ncbi:MAG: TolC family protein [Thiovulaceae bacterium]|nr:TolC family protein [Sulfurimonadaceae bacterium]
MNKIVISLLCTIALFADESPLSQQKQETLDLKRKQIEQDMDVAMKSWISPLILSLSINENKNSLNNNSELQNASLQWNQDLFRSGGIGYTIEQSKANGAANLLGIDIQEATYLKNLYTLKTQIERDKLAVNQSQLTLKNSDIDLLMTKAKYKAGLSDLSQLNQITLNRDTARTNLIVITNSLESETYELKKLIQSKSTDTITIPTIAVPSKEEYLAKNLELLQYNKQDQATEAAWKNKASSYLPKLAFNGSYGYSKNIYNNPYSSDFEGNEYSYGLTLSMPLLDVNANASTQSAKLQYLQTKSAQTDRQIELIQEYEKHINNIRNYNEKIVLADEMIKMYDELYDFTKGQVAAGFKSQYDLDSLQNSVNIQKLEKEIQNYNISIEKITLYFDTKH